MIINLRQKKFRKFVRIVINVGKTSKDAIGSKKISSLNLKGYYPFMLLCNNLKSITKYSELQKYYLQG